MDSDANWNDTYSCLTCMHGDSVKINKGFVCCWNMGIPGGGPVHHDMDIGRNGCDYWASLNAFNEYVERFDTPAEDKSKIQLFGENITELIDQTKFWLRRWRK